MKTNPEIELLFQLELKLANYTGESPTINLNEIMAEGFIEFGSSGKIYNREMAIKSLENNQTKRDIQISGFKSSEVAESVRHVSYIAVSKSDNGSDSITLRSSIWKNSEKGWQIIFHQGTKRQ